MNLGELGRLLVPALLVAAFSTAPALADERSPGSSPGKVQCIGADTEGQSLRLAGKLVEARKRLRGCAAASCPAIVREDCLERIEEIGVAQPTVIFEATNGYGHRLVAVRVSIDGIRVADRLDGRPIAVDPGEHVFVFEALGRMSDRMTLVLHEGEQNERHAVVLRTESGDAEARPPVEEGPPARVVDPAPAEEPRLAPPPASPIRLAPSPSVAAPVATASVLAPPTTLGAEGRIAAVVVGGVGVAAVVVGSVFGSLTFSKWHEATSEVNAPQALQDGVDASHDGNISTAMFIIGGAGLAAAAVLWLASPQSPSGAQTGVRVLPMLGPTQGEVVLRGSF
jgi:hypothetical protein